MLIFINFVKLVLQPVAKRAICMSRDLVRRHTAARFPQHTNAASLQQTGCANTEVQGTHCS
jgi:hypothetical protein